MALKSQKFDLQKRIKSGKVSNADIKKLKIKRKMQHIPFGEGLYLHATREGENKWFFHYSFKKKIRMKELGLFPDMNLQQARKETNRQKRKRRDIKHELFKDVAIEWVTRECKLAGKEIVNDCELKAFVFPQIGDLTVDSINDKHIVSIAEKMKQDGRENIVSNIVDVCCNILNYALNKEVMQPLTIKQCLQKKPHPIADFSSLSPIKVVQSDFGQRVRIPEPICAEKTHIIEEESSKQEGNMMKSDMVKETKKRTNNKRMVSINVSIASAKNLLNALSKPVSRNSKILRFLRSEILGAMNRGASVYAIWNTLKNAKGMKISYNLLAKQVKEWKAQDNNPTAS